MITIVNNLQKLTMKKFNSKKLKIMKKRSFIKEMQEFVAKNKMKL